MNFPAAHTLSDSAASIVQDDAAARPPLVVFASMRWRFDWQRSQQLMTRLARRYRVLYVEEPVATHQDPFLACTQVAPGVETLVAHTRCDTCAFHDDQFPVMARLLGDFMRERGIANPLVWTDTPAALPLVELLQPRGVVYDCHGGVVPSSGDGWLESRLLASADVVVAGGPSLYQSLRGRHANVHCIANAVDAAHFAPPAALDKSIEAVSARAIHAAIPNPRLGFFGVIDERIDLELLARVADLRPDWQIIMAGPLRGVAPEALPRRGNLLWLGAQTYAILPHLQAHWDVCLLPLRCDTTAHHATPIEALEFLAGQKSVVSTPVPDIVALHGHIVRLAPSAHGFVEACRAAMCERGPLRRQRRLDALIAVHACSWDRAAERVHRLMVEFAHDPSAPAERAPATLVAAGLLGATRAAARLPG